METFDTTEVSPVDIQTKDSSSKKKSNGEDAVYLIDTIEDAEALELLLKDRGYNFHRFRNRSDCEKYCADMKGAPMQQPLKMNEGSLELIHGSQSVRFTPKEFSILTPLFASFNSFIRRDVLAEKSREHKSRSLDVHVASIRKKVKPLGLDVETLRGVGYRLSYCETSF